MSPVSSPNEILQLSSKDIERLDEHQLPKLLRYLLAAEANNARKKGEDASYYVPEQINVADGGSDGNWTGPVIPGFVPRNEALFQCKAHTGTLTDAIFKNELAPKTPRKEEYIIKPKIKTIFEQKGAYILLWGHHTINWSPREIREKAEERLKKAGFDLSTEAEILILDSNKIAEWANRHLAAVRYVISATIGSNPYLLKTCDEWERQNAFSKAYYDNDYLKKLSTSIIGELNKPNACIRITGSSGVGKTRFIFETIRGDQKTAYTAVFLDCHDRYSRDIFDLVNYLESTEMSTILIIDNCPTEMHESLERRTTNSGLCLVTISHEIEQFGAPTMPINLDSDKMRDVVVNMLSEDPYLKSNSNSSFLIEKIANYAEGYPSMAKLILQEKRTLSENDLSTRTKFFDALNSARDNVPSAHIVAQALSIFTILGGRQDTLNQHLDAVRNIFCPDVNMPDMQMSIDELKKRNILREEGDTIRIVPPPLAAALASRQICSLKRCSSNALQSKFAQLSEIGLLEKFTNRLTELENSPELNDLISVLGIPFQDADYLVSGHEGALIFRSLVDLASPTAMDIAERSLVGRTTDQLKADIKPRRNLVIGLEKLAWNHDLFQRASSLLLRLAAGENETWANNATGSLQQLFHIYLSGTSCPVIERLEVLKKYLKSDDESIRTTAIKIFAAIFRMSHFMKGVTVSLSDLQKTKDDWKPNSNDEILRYWEQAFFILKEFIVAKKSNFREALKILGENLATISETPLILQPNIDTAFKEISDTVQGGWTEALTSLKHTLRWNSPNNEEHRKAQQSWLNYLEKGSWPVSVKITNIVSLPGWHFSDDNIDLSLQEAQKLAHTLIADKTSLDGEILKSLMIGEQQQAWGFGEIYGKENNETLERLFDASFDQWRAISSRDNKNFSFLSGVMKGMGAMHPLRAKILDRISKDSVLAELLVPLTSSVKIENFSDLDRIVRVIMEDAIPPQSILGLIQGLPLSSLPTTKICSCMQQLLDGKPEIAPFIIQILYIYFFHNEWEYAPFRELIRTLLLMDENWDSDGNLPTDWKNLASRELKELHDESDKKQEWVIKFLKYITERLYTENVSYHTEKEISKLFEDIVDGFGNEILDTITQLINNRNILQLRSILSDSKHTPFDASNKTWLTKIPQSTLFDWVEANPEIVDILLESIALYTISDQDEWQWEPFVLKLMKQSTQPPIKVAQKIDANLGSFGSTGSRLPYWEKREKLVKKLIASDEAKLIEIGDVLLNFIKERKNYIQREEKNRKNWNEH